MATVECRTPEKNLRDTLFDKSIAKSTPIVKEKLAAPVTLASEKLMESDWVF